MPYAAPNLSDEEKEKQQGQGVNVSGQSASFSSNVPGQDAGTPKSSGQYANIQKYLGANQTQANEMGQGLAGDVEQRAKESQSLTEQYSKQAPKVDAYDPNQAIGKVGGLTDSEKALYKTQKSTGGYTGPESFDTAAGYQEAQKAAQDASQRVSQAGTEQGQQELLKQKYARPDYSAGQNKLDQALLQYSPDAKTGFENLKSKYSNLNDLFGNAQSNVGNAINDANKQALANKQAFSPAEKAAREGLLNPIQARAAQANIDNPAMVERYYQDLQDEKVNQDVMEKLGLSEGQNIYDLNLANYLNKDLSTSNMNNVASADERTKYAQLAGLFDDPTMNQIDANGKAISPVGFNKAQFEKDQAAAAKQYDDIYRNAWLHSAGQYGNGMNQAVRAWAGDKEANWMTDSAATLEKVRDKIANRSDRLLPSVSRMDGSSTNARVTPEQTEWERAGFGGERTGPKSKQAYLNEIQRALDGFYKRQNRDRKITKEQV